MTIVECNDLQKGFPIKKGLLGRPAGFVKVLDGVSLRIEKGETLGLVGGSGCGKTTLGKIILGILKPDSGNVHLETKALQAIFQDPFNSLDPKMKVVDIIAEALILKGDTSGMTDRVREILELVRLPVNSINKYPYAFSGGERQRIAIARAVITHPEFIVCDEPVSNLDITIQVEILRLLKDLQKRFSITYLFISHDMRVVRFMCDRIAVMEDGKVKI